MISPSRCPSTEGRIDRPIDPKRLGPDEIDQRIDGDTDSLRMDIHDDLRPHSGQHSRGWPGPGGAGHVGSHRDDQMNQAKGGKARDR